MVSVDEFVFVLKEFFELSWQVGYDGKLMMVVKVVGKEQKFLFGGYIQMYGEVGDVFDVCFNGIWDCIFLCCMCFMVKGFFVENFDFMIQLDFGNNFIGGVLGYWV